MRKNAAAAAAILPRLAIHTELAARVLVGFVRDAVAKAGLTRCVVGLSGGIDSALAATIAARALGPANVFAVRLPAAESSAACLEDASLLIEQLSLPHMDFPSVSWLHP